jgi:membrane fusion protein (multidrug efflux system)
VINSGLKPGERVIVDGVLKIGPGAPVNVTEPAAPATNGKPAATPAVKPENKPADQPKEKPAAKPAVKS